MVTPLRHSARVLHDRRGQRHRRGSAGERHRDEFGRDAVPRAVDQVLAGQVAPEQRRRRAGSRTPPPGSRPAPARCRPRRTSMSRIVHQVSLRKAPVTIGLRMISQRHVEAVEVADLRRDVGANHRGALCVDLRQHLDQFHEVHEVRRQCRALPLGIGIEDRDRRGAGIELDAVAAIVHDGLAVERVEMELMGRGLEGAPHDHLRDPDDAVRTVDGGARAGKQVERLVVVYPDARVHQQFKSLPDDPLQQIVGKHPQSWSHACSPRPNVTIGRWQSAIGVPSSFGDERPPSPRLVRIPVRPRTSP